MTERLKGLVLKRYLLSLGNIRNLTITRALRCLRCMFGCIAERTMLRRDVDIDVSVRADELMVSFVLLF